MKLKIIETEKNGKRRKDYLYLSLNYAWPGLTGKKELRKAIEKELSSEKLLKDQPDERFYFEAWSFEFGYIGYLFHGTYNNRKKVLE